MASRGHHILALSHQAWHPAAPSQASRGCSRLGKLAGTRPLLTVPQQARNTPRRDCALDVRTRRAACCTHHAARIAAPRQRNPWHTAHTTASVAGAAQQPPESSRRGGHAPKQRPGQQQRHCFLHYRMRQRLRPMLSAGGHRQPTGPTPLSLCHQPATAALPSQRGDAPARCCAPCRPQHTQVTAEGGCCLTLTAGTHTYKGPGRHQVAHSHRNYALCKGCSGSSGLASCLEAGPAAAMPLDVHKHCSDSSRPTAPATGGNIAAGDCCARSTCQAALCCCALYRGGATWQQAECGCRQSTPTVCIRPHTAQHGSALRPAAGNAAAKDTRTLAAVGAHDAQPCLIAVHRPAERRGGRLGITQSPHSSWVHRPAGSHLGAPLHRARTTAGS
jgi:hypothetical protein